MVAFPIPSTRIELSSRQLETESVRIKEFRQPQTLTSALFVWKTVTADTSFVLASYSTLFAAISFVSDVIERDQKKRRRKGNESGEEKRGWVGL